MNLGESSHFFQGLNEDLLQFIHHVSSAATTQFFKGLIFGIFLTIIAGMVSIRALLFRSPKQMPPRRRLFGHEKFTPSQDHYQRKRTTSSTQEPSSQVPTLLYPLGMLLLLHRRRTISDNRLFDRSSHVEEEENETLAFFNYLICEVIQLYRADSTFHNWLKVDIIQKSCNAWLPKFMDQVLITELSLGQFDQFPLFKNARLRSYIAHPKFGSNVEFSLDMLNPSNLENLESTWVRYIFPLNKSAFCGYP
jgi:hypothetical protein